MKLTHEIIDITPELAKKWLDESEFENRNIKKSNLDKLIRDIQSGKWVFDGSPIRFDRDNNVIDGQHRLTAVIRTGKTIKSLVIRGIVDRAKLTIDTGSNRSTSDILYFTGEKNTIPLSVAGRLAAAYNESDGDLIAFSRNKSSKSLTVQQIADVIEQNPEISDSVSRMSGKSNIRKFLGLGVAGFLRYILSQSNYGYLCDEFFDRLDSGISSKDGDPILAARTTLLLGISATSGTKLQAIKCAIVIKAWNLHVKQGVAKYIRYNENEKYPMVA